MTSHVGSRERPAPVLGISSGDELGRRVRAARSYAQLTIPQLAEQIGLGAQTIKRIENGTRAPRRHEVWAIAEACGMPRGFFELSFEHLVERGEQMTGLLAAIDKRLLSIESRLGVSTAQS